MRFAKDNETPLVSVCLITYKHERWIAASIESVLMQETDFPCEFIIADDCSPDKTRDIILSYSKKFPIRLILQNPNKGAAGNFRDMLKSARGKYIAYLEGDDAWENSHKLQMQADLLEANPSLSMCYSNARVYDTQNPDAAFYLSEATKPLKQLDKYISLEHCVIPSLTMFFKNIVKDIPEWFYKTLSGDYFLVYLLSRYGDIYYQDEIFGIYNHHYNGIGNARNASKWAYNDTVLSYNLIPYFDSDKKVKNIILRKHVETIDNIFHRRAYWLSIRLFWHLPFHYIARKPAMYINIARMFIKVHFLFFLSKNLKTAI